MDGWMIVWMGGSLYGWVVDDGIDVCMDGWMTVRMGGRLYGWVDDCMVGWMDNSIDG